MLGDGLNPPLSAAKPRYLRRADRQAERCACRKMFIVRCYATTSETETLMNDLQLFLRRQAVNLAPTKRRCSAAGKVTAGLAESNSSIPPEM